MTLEWTIVSMGIMTTILIMRMGGDLTLSNDYALVVRLTFIFLLFKKVPVTPPTRET